MARVLCRVEGVNFDATVFDTNDLSTIRGASLALLSLHETVSKALPDGATLLYAGASQCAHLVETDQTAEDIQRTVTRALAAVEAGPLAHLTTVVDVVPAEADDPRPALDRAEARNHARQFRQWTLDPLPFTSEGRDVGALERARPGTVASTLPKGKVARLLDPHAEDPDQTEEPRLSPAVRAKRTHGRTARQAFFADQLKERSQDILGKGGDRLLFTDSLQAMVEDAPAAVPISPRGKVAVVYADGNAFGAAREKAGVKAFSSALSAFRTALLDDILTWFATGARDPKLRPYFAVEENNRTGLRLETLLWGGDEAMFAMPAWLALPFARGFFAATDHWTVEHEPLTHAVGIIIADRKTPIRQLTALAHASADMAKEAGLNDRSTMTVDIFESLAPPDETFALAQTRATLLGGEDGEGRDRRIARALALPATPSDQKTLFDHLARIKGVNGEDGFPRSQIHAALRAATRGRSRLLDTTAATRANDVLDEHALRMGGDVESVSPTGHPLPSVDGKRPLPVDLALVANLWDYLHFDGPALPLFPSDKTEASA